MYDLMIRGATLQDGQSGVDIACRDGIIVEIGSAIAGEATRTIDAQGCLVTPPFVDAHWHLDAALQRDNLPSDNGLLYDGIDAWARLKAEATVDGYKDRIRHVLAWAVANGLLHIRCQTDICDPELRQVQALVELREELRSIIDLQLVAFPQDGFLRDRSARSLMTKALDLGLDVVGGIPDYELTASLGQESVRLLCEIAAERGLFVDMHIDQTSDGQSRQIEALSQEAIRLDLGGRVSASHCIALAEYPAYYADKIISQVAQSGINVCVQPFTAATAWGMMTRLGQLHDAGVNIAFGQDGVMDPWYPFGMCDMLDVGHMAIVYGRLLGESHKRMVFDGITYGGARALGLSGYGIGVGRDANLVVLQAADPMEAIRLRATRLFVIREGRVLATQAERVASIKLPHGEITVDFRQRDARSNERGLKV